MLLARRDMRLAGQNIESHGVAGKILWNKELLVVLVGVVDSHFGNGWYCLQLTTMRHFNIHGAGGLWKAGGMRLEE